MAKKKGLLSNLFEIRECYQLISGLEPGSQGFGVAADGHEEKRAHVVGLLESVWDWRALHLVCPAFEEMLGPPLRWAIRAMRKRLGDKPLDNLFGAVRKHALTSDEIRFFVDVMDAVPLGADPEQDVLGREALGQISPVAGEALGRYLRKRSHLRELHFTGNRKFFVERGLASLLVGLADAELPKLVELDLRHCDIGSTAPPGAVGELLAQFLGRCPALCKVAFEGNRGLFSSEGLQGIVGGLGLGRGLKSLRAIQLCDFDVDPEAGEVLGQFLSGCGKLEQVDFDGSGGTELLADSRLFTELGVQGLLRGIDEQRGLSRIQELGLRDCKIEPEVLRQFLKCCPNLLKVEQDGNTKVSRARGMTMLSANPGQSRIHDGRYQDVLGTAGVVLGFLLHREPRVGTVQLSGYGIDNRFMTEGLKLLVEGLGPKCLQDIRELQLRGCSVSAAATQRLGGFLVDCTHLEHLDLDQNAKLCTPEALANLAAGVGGRPMEQLRQLDLRHCGLAVGIGEPLGRLLRCCPKLERAHFNGNQCFAPEGFEGLALGLGETELPALLELDFFCCDMPATSGAPLGKFLLRCRQIQRLNLSYNPKLCTAEGLAGLRRSLACGADSLGRLDVLQLRCCSMAADSGVDLGWLLAHCAALRKLQLSGNVELATARGLRQLREGLAGRQLVLEELHLGSCDLSADDLLALDEFVASCPQLAKPYFC